jgi:hypothetical protein
LVSVYPKKTTTRRARPEKGGQEERPACTKSE